MKAAIIHVSTGMLTEICKAQKDSFLGCFEVADNPLPQDAEPIKMFDAGNGKLGILIKSETFQDIPEGHEYPILPPTMVTARQL